MAIKLRRRKTETKPTPTPTPTPTPAPAPEPAVTKAGRHNAADSGPTHYSPSRIGLFRSCPRRGFAQYVLGMRDSGGEAADRGTACHAMLEGYLLGIPQDWESKLGRQVVRILPHVPEPGPGITPEAEVRFQWEGYHYLLISDVQDMRDPENPVICDLKTKGSKSGMKAAPGKRALQKDTQVILNALSCIAREAFQGQVKTVTTRWMYLDSVTDIEPKIVEIVWQPEEVIAAHRELIHPEVVRIEAMSRAVEGANQVAGSIDHCSAYPPNGCPFRGLCGTNLATAPGGGLTTAKRHLPMLEMEASPQHLELIAHSYNLTYSGAEAAYRMFTGQVPEGPEDREAVREAAKQTLFAKAATAAILKSFNKESGL